MTILNRFSYGNERKKSILERFRSRFKGSKLTQKERILRASYLLETTLNKLKHISLNLKNRDQRVFDRCIKAALNNNRIKAKVYANECVELRRLARLVMTSELALEQAILRLETISEVSDVILAVGPILSIIKETKGRLTGIVPSIADKLGEINTVLNGSLSEMGSFYSSKVSVSADEIPIKINEETIKILEEANEAAAAKIRDRFPKLPMEFESQEKPNGAKIPVALTALGRPVPNSSKINEKRE